MGGFAVPLVRAVAGVLAAVAAVPAMALAHGPCGCLEPASGPPGTRVRTAYPIYKVIFNPDRTDLAIGPESLWRRHRGGAAASSRAPGAETSGGGVPVWVLAAAVTAALAAGFGAGSAARRRASR